MAIKVIVSAEAAMRYNEIVSYLLTEWPLQVAIDFESKFDEMIKALCSQPYMGVRSESDNSVRHILITPHNMLSYHFDGKTIYIITIWDTRQDDKTRKY